MITRSASAQHTWLHGRVPRGLCVGALIRCTQPLTLTPRSFSSAAAGRQTMCQAEPAVGAVTLDEATRREITDPSKAMTFRVGKLGREYDEFVHHAQVRWKPAMFDTPFIEKYVSRNPPWLIPIVWIPLIIHWSMESLQSSMGVGAVLLTFAAGIVLWAFMEYLLHRYVFHFVTTTYWGNTFHFLLHGIHHLSPMDADRLVFPPVLSVPFGFACRALVSAALGNGAGAALTAGAAFGYLNYDVTHWYLHHGKPTSWLYRTLKEYHVDHHFRNHDVNFGISPFAKVLDFAFGTHLPPLAKKEGGRAQ